MELPAIALDLLLPRRCLLCDEASSKQMLCAPCRADLPWLANACTRCALPLQDEAEICGRCLGKPPAFDACFAAFHYASPVDRLIGQFKNQRRLSAGKILSRLLLSILAERRARMPDVIAPVPLHWRRQIARGFNQAAFVAGYLARELNVPLVDLARRSQATPKQQQLDRKQRLRNLRDAFSITADVTGRRIALLDDVVTTGATAQALSLALKRAGAARVEVWAIARTPEPTR
ncbi:ComF family protein [Proteobacteria bacterium 005FR1]|nr:ComF family protein [Proteobacteria bacterium 005FR1]